MEQTIIQMLASACGAYHRCAASDNEVWRRNWIAIIWDIENNQLPSGSGIDAGCKIDVDRSNDDRVVITFGYHHMDEHGHYDGWTEHELWVYPAFHGIRLNITGRNRYMVKEYLYELFSFALMEPYKTKQQ